MKKPEGRERAQGVGVAMGRAAMHGIGVLAWRRGIEALHRPCTG